MTVPSGHIGCLFDAHIWCTFHLWPKFTANNNNNTIRVPIHSQVCIISTQKMKRKHSFLPKCSLGTQENWVWLALPKNMWSSWHVLRAPILTLIGSCLASLQTYLILSGLQHWGNLKKGNLKVIQIRGMIPRWRNTNFVLNGWGSFTGQNMIPLKNKWSALFVLKSCVWLKT